MARFEGQARRKRVAGTAFRIVCIGGTLIALWWFLRGLDVARLTSALRQAAPGPLALAMLFGVLGHGVRAWGWSIMLAPRHHPPFGRLLRFELTSQAASAITPARAGEGLRVWLLHRSDEVPAATTGALIGIKKLFEGVGLAVLALPAPWLVEALPGWAGNAVLLFAITMGTLVVLLAVYARRDRSRSRPSIVRRLGDGLYFMRDNRRLAVALVVAVFGEMLDLAAVVAIQHALDLPLGLAAAAFVLFLVDTLNLLPSAPAHVGTFEVGVFTAFGLLGVQGEAVLAFALVFHLQQVLTQMVVGVPFLLAVFITRRRLPAQEPA
ncbi:lysylphosphatidylglycerol synthase transmembrane domain-containing protein [Actinoplanes xinjiangensis]|uniref:Lysylphosphatidylglycerol synthase-like protein n=1 Tax=Actinoplanes xinjiangensis TaxID=512350 RepID=A0A316EW14_9ACTN|nr:lysylphosphatidylglycerol synthase transmembrane domain-containing protein [Actinoplanes xinjiangensis]PWK36025.1 hypothetical protein BC793_1246 [Actinoplanes xinjiangensis]GIF42977.1 TIGR00374 family protein [Actinoplanes xinjiangensis]